MCEKAVEDDARSLAYVSDRFKTQKMFIKALKVDPWQLHDIPDQFKTQKICDKTVKDDLYSLQFVPDWFVTQQQLKIWHDDDDYCNDDELIEWYNGYQKRKAQKAQIKEELMPIAWHPSRWWGWCVLIMKNKKSKNCRHKHETFLCLVTGYKNFFYI